MHPLFAYENWQPMLLKNWLLLLPAVHQLPVSVTSGFCRDLLREEAEQCIIADLGFLSGKSLCPKRTGMFQNIICKC